MQMTTYICDGENCDAIMENKPDREFKVDGATLKFDGDYCHMCKENIIAELDTIVTLPDPKPMEFYMDEDFFPSITEIIAEKMTEDFNEAKEGWPEYNGPFYKSSDIG